MKKNNNILLIVCLILTFMNVSCQDSEPSMSGNESSDQMSATIYLMYGQKTYSIMENDARFVADLTNKSEFKNFVYKCHFDFVFIVDEEEWSYCSDHGVFSHIQDEKSFKLSLEENERIRRIINSAGIVLAKQ